MRVLFSYVFGILILASMLAVGGAWAPWHPSDLREFHPPASSVRLGLIAEFESELAAPEPSVLPPGCVGPVPGAVCAPTVLAGGLDLPRTVADLVPAAPVSIEDWRPLVTVFFKPRHVERALAIIRCESGGDSQATNPMSSAAGLFQHLGSQWQERTSEAGMEGADIMDPVASVEMVAWLVYDGGGWSHWNASRSCWGRA